MWVPPKPQPLLLLLLLGLLLLAVAPPLAPPRGSWAPLLLPGAGAASVEEVLSALDGAGRASEDFHLAIGIMKNLVVSKVAALNISGRITLLLPRNDQVAEHELAHFSTPVRRDILHMHTLQHAWPFYSLQDLPDGSRLRTKGPHRVRKQLAGQSIYFEPELAERDSWQGCGEACWIMVPHLHDGSNVVVHGLACLLSPPGLKHGPFCPLSDA